MFHFISTNNVPMKREKKNLLKKKKKIIINQILWEYKLSEQKNSDSSSDAVVYIIYIHELQQRTRFSLLFGCHCNSPTGASLSHRKWMKSYSFALTLTCKTKEKKIERLHRFLIKPKHGFSDKFAGEKIKPCKELGLISSYDQVACSQAVWCNGLLSLSMAVILLLLHLHFKERSK